MTRTIPKPKDAILVVDSRVSRVEAVSTPKPTPPKVKLADAVKAPTKQAKKDTKKATGKFTPKPHLTHRPFAGLSGMLAG